MNTVKIDFEKRVKEIEIYFSIVKDIVEYDSKLFFEKRKSLRYKKIDDDLKKILKANCFVLLYNLIESSIRQSLIEIYENISNSNYLYKKVSSKIQKIWIEDEYNKFLGKNLEDLHSIIKELEFNKIILNHNNSKSIKSISGNIDQMKIKEFSKLIGFSDMTPSRLGKGKYLNLIMRKRNDLAHGNISFANCGREYSFNDLFKYKNHVIKFLRKILDNIDSFLKLKKYKK